MNRSLTVVLSVLCAWVLWSKATTTMKEIDELGGKSYASVNWSPVEGFETLSACNGELKKRQASISATTEARQLTYQCWPEALDPRPKS